MSRKKTKSPRRRRVKPKVVIEPELMPYLYPVLGSIRGLLEDYRNRRSTPPHSVPINIQALVDRLLWKVMDGEDPRAVFGTVRRDRKRRDWRYQACMCAEVLRLSKEISEADAKKAVAEHCATDVRTVQRQVTKWKPYLTEGIFADFMDSYEHNLRVRKLID